MNVFGVIVVILFLVGIIAVVYGAFKFFVAIMSAPTRPSYTPRTSTDAADEIDGMNEGDIHSGPYGYSPNTAYPQTQYGSLFNDDAEWAHEHED